MRRIAEDLRADEQLVAAARDGDADAFEVLYYRYRDWVVRLALRFTGDEAEALDVLQEVFLYLARKLPELELRARLTTLLYPAVKNVAINLRRKRLRLVTNEELLERQVAAAPADPGGQRSELEQDLAMLPEAQREVVLMRFADDMSLAEIAAAMAVPLGTVKSRLHHALAKLRAGYETRE